MTSSVANVDGERINVDQGLAVATASLSLHSTPISLPDRDHLTDIPDKVAFMLKRLSDWAISTETNTSLFEDSRDVASFAQALRLEVKELSSLQRELARLHSEHLSKWIPESGGSPFWSARLVKTPPAAQPFSPAIIALLQELLGADASEAQDFDTPEFKTSVSRGTNHGWPTWASSDEDHLAHIALGESIKRGYTSIDSAIEWLSSHLSVGSLKEPVLTLLTRSGPIRKPQPLYDWRGDSVVEIGSSVGLFCRRRDVNGVPTWLNEIARADVMRATTRLKNSPTFSHGPEASDSEKIQLAVRVLGKSAKIYSDDATSFDDSIGLEHLKQIARCYPASSRGVRTLHSLCDTMALLAPPIRRGFEASIVQRNGTMASGLVYTSVETSLINLACILTCLGRAAYQSEAAAISAFQDGTLFIFVQGDDSLIVTTKTIDLDKYTSAAAEFGYTRKIETLPVFLMTWHSPHSYFGLSSRALMRTTARERRAPTATIELLGVFSRWARCRDDPFFETFWRLLPRNSLFERFGIRTFKDVWALMLDPWFVGQLMKDLESLSLQAKRSLRETAERLRLLAIPSLNPFIDRILASDSVEILTAGRALHSEWRNLFERMSL